MRISLISLCLAAGLASLAANFARADEIRNPNAIFAGLDKITGRIISFDVAMDETVQFGTLQITPRVCLTRPQTEAPLTDSFVEVDEVESTKTAKRIFSGWMFSASPGLHGVEHPVYDVWLKDCKGGKDVVASPAARAAPDVSAAPPANAQPAAVPGRKPRRTIKPQDPVEPQMDPAPPAQDPGALQAPAAPAPAAPGAPEPPALGPPVEVGAPPGANPAGDSGAGEQPVAAPPQVKKPKKKRKPPPPVLPDGVERQPLDAPPVQQPRRERLEPVSPNILPRNLF
jgi:hypothetical protein